MSKKWKQCECGREAQFVYADFKKPPWERVQEPCCRECAVQKFSQVSLHGKFHIFPAGKCESRNLTLAEIKSWPICTNEETAFYKWGDTIPRFPKEHE